MGVESQWSGYQYIKFVDYKVVSRIFVLLGFMLSYLHSYITFFDGLMLLNRTVDIILNLLVPPEWNYNVTISGNDSESKYTVA